MSPPPPARPDRRWRTAVIVLAVLAVGLAVGLVVALASGGSDSSSTGTSTGRQTIGQACAQLRLLPTSGFDDDRVMIDRMSLATVLGQLAHDQDATLTPLAETIAKVQNAFARTYSTKSPALLAALADAKTACAGY